MFFRETKETEEDIRRMFHHVREKMKQRITLKKKTDPGKFAIPCVGKGIEFPHPLCDTGASVNLVELGNDLSYIAACHCGAEYETEYTESIDTHTVSSIDSNESPTTDERYPTSLDGKQLVDHLALLDQCYPDFAFQQPNNRGRDDYSIGSWADSGLHEVLEWILMTDIKAIPSTTRLHHRSTEFTQHQSIPTLIQQNVLMHRSIPYLITSHDTEAEKMNALTNQSEGTSRRSIQSKNPNSTDKRLPSIDTPVSTSIDTHSKPQLSLFTKKNMSMDYGFLTPDEFDIFRDPDGHARAMDGRILKHSRQHSHSSRRTSRGYHNSNWFTPLIPTSWPRIDRQGCSNIVRQGNTNVVDKRPSPSIDRRYEFGHRAYDIYGAKKFRWEHKDGYGVYKDEFGYARSVAGEMIPVTKENIRKILESASLYEESHICLPEQATSFTPTRLALEIYTKDEINEMVTGIWGAQERLGDELKTLEDDTYQPLDRGYNELFRSMADMRTKIESMQHSLEKEATTSPSIDAYKATSSMSSHRHPKSLQNRKIWTPFARRIHNQPHRSISAPSHRSTASSQQWKIGYNLYEDMHDRFTSPIMRYLDTLSTHMMKVQKDIGKLNDQHDFQEEGQTSIDRFQWTSLDGKKPTEHLPYTASEVDQITSKLYTAIDTMEERLEKRCDDIYFPFDISASIDRARSKSIDSTAPATIDRHIVASTDTKSTSDDEQLIHNKMESMHEELNELSAYAYDKIGWHQFNIETLQERLQNISNAIQKMDERWTRNDEAKRSFIAA
ncbi:hypothetical protein F2Q69_00052447 [Brassica cretica]|uniref:Uncharacterized protein n=1 Tax=Brassica cretica TaxID=69181 RepID=A0A8S9N306_BRACR|nr:hypothetical protein F2Q69_00052447 [Brassica cretica]